MKEQAVFRRVRGTTEQTFVPRDKMEQSIQWQTTLYIHVVDFEKALILIQSTGTACGQLIMQSDDIPYKMISMVKIPYDFECAVVDEEDTTESGRA